MTKDADDKLATFVADLRGVETVTGLKAVFENTATSLGFKCFTYHVVKLGGVEGRLPYVITTYPDDWVKRYFSQGYIYDDPVIDLIHTHQLPFTWSQSIDPRSFSDRQEKLFSEAGEAGLANGLTVPIHGRNGEYGAITLVPDGTSAEQASSIAEHRNLLHLMSLYYHGHASSILVEHHLSSPRQKSLLSPREKEALQWSATGKSCWEVSVILGISERSVEAHLDKAKNKLGVFNRTHAVVKAIMLGMISLE